MSATPLLDTARVVRRPSFIHAAGLSAHLETFDDVSAVAARIVALTPGATDLHASREAWPAAYFGLDVFFAFSVYRHDPSGAVTWVGSVALPPCAAKPGPEVRAQLQAALSVALHGQAARAAA